MLIRLAHALKTSLVGIGEAYRMGGDEFCVLATDAHQSELIERASEALTERGEGFSVTASRGWVDLPTEASEPSEALRLADQRMYASKTSGGRASAGRQTTDVLVRMLAERHPEIGDHLSEVAALSDLVGQELGLDESERSSVVQAASLLDIGKVAIPESVLSRPGPLDEDESRLVRQHTLIGERILAAAPALIRASKLVRWSHERMDGEGYPDGIPGERIPIGSQIVAVCDAYEAMTSERPHVEPMRSEDALTELRRCAGTQFDARVVEAFAVALGKRQSEKTESADGGAIWPLAASS
ncbi:MAG: HD domain-containing phosphohydrolase [bacterium]